MLTNSMRGYINREITIKKINVNIFSGISIEKIAISYFPDFSAGTSFTCDGITMQVNLRELVKGNMLFEHVKLEYPEIYVRDFPVCNQSVFTQLYASDSLKIFALRSHFLSIKKISIHKGILQYMKEGVASQIGFDGTVQISFNRAKQEISMKNLRISADKSNVKIGFKINQFLNPDAFSFSLVLVGNSDLLDEIIQLVLKDVIADEIMIGFKQKDVVRVEITGDHSDIEVSYKKVH